MRKLINLLARNRARGPEAIKAEGNVIYVYDVIVASDEDAAWFGGCSAEGFVKTLRGMTGDVELRINSPGGDVFGGRAMASAMREYSGSITAHVDGYAASAASILAVSADQCVMAPGSFLMIHKAWTIALGNADDFLAVASLLEKIDGTLVDTYAAKAGADHPWADMLAAETWFTAQEAVDIGLADSISADKPQNAVEWDLSAYDAAPQITASAQEPEVEELTVGLSATIGADYGAQEQQRRERINALRLRSIPA